jgi:hypothetical protein
MPQKNTDNCSEDFFFFLKRSTCPMNNGLIKLCDKVCPGSNFRTAKRRREAMSAEAILPRLTCYDQSLGDQWVPSKSWFPPFKSCVAWRLKCATVFKYVMSESFGAGQIS